MRLCTAALSATLVALVALGSACATRDSGLIKTQVVTFPDGALVQYNGHTLGRSPADVILPQDQSGRLTERAEVRAVPNTDQTTLYAQSRVFDPSNRVDRIPNRIMIDMTLHDTNQVPGTNQLITSTADLKPRKTTAKPRRVQRSKPTEAVGLDRWSPGIY